MSRATSPNQPAQAPGLLDAEHVQDMLHQAVAVLQGVLDGEYPAGVVYATLAGLETAVVVLETPGGLVPVFAHVNENLAPLLRNYLGELPQPFGGERSLLAS